MGVLGFTILVMMYVVSHPILNPADIYNVTEQYKVDTIAYYTELAEIKEAEKQSYIEEVPVVVNGDAGRLEIPSIGINVGLYYDGNAFQSSGKASYQYWIQYGKFWITDHVNQDNFGSLRNISIGSSVYVYNEDGSCNAYTVAESIYFEDYYSNFAGCGATAKMSDYKNVGGLVIQTCEGNGARLIFCN